MRGNTVNSLVGVGLYSIREAAGILRAQPRELRRWIMGYSYLEKSGDRHEQPSVSGVSAELAALESMTFFDLLEARLIKGFRARHISLQAIRQAIDVARQMYSDQHPFVFQRIETDGRSIFAQAATDLVIRF